jgi:excisionase family DNA binding protein
MPILKEQTLTRTYGLIDALRREGRADDAATVEALLNVAQREEADYLTTAEAAARLGVSRQAVVSLIRRGHLAGVRIAGRSMITQVALDRYKRIRRVLDDLDADRPPLSPEEAERVGQLGRKDWPWRDDPS